MKNQVFYFLFLGFLWAGCDSKEESSRKTENKLLTWIKVQEEQINLELINRIAQDQLSNPTDTTWMQKGFVVTENDPTVLGELARQLKTKSNCYYVEYLFTPALTARKIIKIGQEQTDSCKNIVSNSESNDDTTRYFIIENLPD